MKHRIVLASASPRRRGLLAQAGIVFDVIPSQGSEKTSRTRPDEAVKALAFAKAFESAAHIPKEEREGARTYVIGADTAVASGDDILGKPVDEADAARMLARLQGAAHQVYTGVCIITLEEGGIVNIIGFHECTTVKMYPMTQEEIKAYVATGEPLDKAGSYGIQGRGAVFIEKIDGDYSNVVGLPIAKVYRALECAKRHVPGQEHAFKAVIFDLDGTLADTLESIAYCTNRALAAYGFAPFALERYKYFVGDGAAELIRRVLRSAGDDALEYYDKVKAEYDKLFAKDCMYKVAPYEGIVELLQTLKKRGIKTAVLSNKPHEQAKDVVRTLFGEGLFCAVQGQSESIRKKPSPDGVLYLAEKLGEDRENILYLGDTDTDMKTGKSAGVFTIGALWGFREREELEENYADAVIAMPYELINYL